MEDHIRLKALKSHKLKLLEFVKNRGTEDDKKQ